MRVRFRRPMWIENPEWSEVAHATAKKHRVPYRVPRHVQAPAGTEWDAPEMTLLLKQGIADPVDDEAKAYVSHWDDDVLREREEAYDLLEKGMATGDSMYDNEPEDGEDDDVGVEPIQVTDETPLQELGD